MENQILVLKRKPAGLPVVEDFELIEEEMPANQDGELLLKSIYISVDPYLRGKYPAGGNRLLKLDSLWTQKLLLRS